ncbi:hypothetical protein TD95_000511 [Thielaviopsis punctulata]|uniref:Potassium channel tetramerisation-type BTB domain-containing protein n=1 Tax=Thielaviopsis punctulata TaxID=72032 RepID=A0A0F4ZAW4_9PEZI|nr:hypothetical protein TD95_000511 [Thielaviopsis punctulata]
MAHPMVVALGEGAFPPSTQVHAQAQTQPQAQSQSQSQPQSQKQTQARPIDAAEDVSHIPRYLPHERVFPIQIGCQLFKLSGASISSDAPSYFSQWFKCKLQEAERIDTETPIPTLYIDRDPDTFRDIALHLQGYHVKPRDGTHFVRLFADAQFYQRNALPRLVALPKLISQLYDESVFMSIGGREFQIPRELFMTPENSPNYFSLGFAVFFSNKEDLFPGLNREGLLRPPSIQPPCVPNRSAEIFEEILDLLRGYTVEIRSPAHREALLRDVRYFNFKGLEQKLIPYNISYNAQRDVTEITMRLEDIMKSGLFIRPDSTVVHIDPHVAWLTYKRPHADANVNQPMDLVIEIGTEIMKLHISSQNGTRNAHAEFIGITKNKIGKMLQIIAGMLGLPLTRPEFSDIHTGVQPIPAWSPLSGEYMHCLLEPETAIILDGEPFSFEADDGMLGQFGTGESSRKRRRMDLTNSMSENWTVVRGLWRVKVQSRGVNSGQGGCGLECVLVGVKIDAVTSENARNTAREFLS